MSHNGVVAVPTTGIYPDLQEFLQELVSIPGLIGICFEMESGESVARGYALGDIFGEQRARITRSEIVSFLTSSQDVFAMTWADLHLATYRVGQQGLLWAYCVNSSSQGQVGEVWKKRRGPWASRLEGNGLETSQDNESGWRKELTPRILKLLRATESLFVALRASEVQEGATRAHEEFESLTEEWASFCDPSVISFPMLLDSLRQCLSAEGEGRAEFFERMQEVMSESLGS